MPDPFGGEDLHLPDTPVPEGDQAFPAGTYVGIVGRVLPFWAGKDGKKTERSNPEARMTNITQEIWVLEAPEKKEKEEFPVLTPRILIQEGIVSFPRLSSVGVKLFESFPTPSNPLFDKLSWKAKMFYSSFPGVIVGETGAKKVVWEAVKAHIGMMMVFDIEYSDKKSKSGYPFRNITNVGIGGKTRYDIETIAKIESLYHQYKAQEQANKENRNQPSSGAGLDAAFSGGQKPADEPPF